MKLQFREYDPQQMRERAREYYEQMRSRRSVRDFSDRVVDREVIEHCLLTAGSAPSGANKRPPRLLE